MKALISSELESGNMLDWIRRILQEGRAPEILHQLVFLLVGFYIFINPFPHITAIKEIAFYSSAGLVLILLLLKKTDFSFRSPLSLPFAMFVAWACIGLFLALDKTNSVHDLWSHLIKYILLYYFLVHFFHSSQRFIFLVWLIIFSSLIFVVGNLVYFYGILGYELKTRLGLHLIEIQTNLIGPIVVSAILFALQGLRKEKDLRRRWFLIASLIGMGVALFMTQSRGAVIALFVGTGILFWNQKKYIVILALVMTIVIASSPRKDYFAIRTMLHDGRFSINLVTLGVIRDYPVFGIGFGMETYANRSFLKPYYEELPKGYERTKIELHPHNIFLDTAVRVGLVGLGFFLWILYRVFQVGWKITSEGKDDFTTSWARCLGASFAAILIQGMFEPTLHGPVAIMMFTVMAMITILWKQNGRNGEP